MHGPPTRPNHFAYNSRKSSHMTYFASKHRVFERSVSMSPVTPIDDTPTPEGRVEIAEAAVISVIHESVLSIYGVVELGPKSSQSALRRRFTRHDPSRGINIENVEERLKIDLSIVVEYGTP